MYVETGRETQSTPGVVLQASWEITLYFTPFLVFLATPFSPWHPYYPSTHFSPTDGQLYNYLDTADIFVLNCLLGARLASVEGKPLLLDLPLLTHLLRFIPDVRNISGFS